MPLVPPSRTFRSTSSGFRNRRAGVRNRPGNDRFEFFLRLCVGREEDAALHSPSKEHLVDVSDEPVKLLIGNGISRSERRILAEIPSCDPAVVPPRSEEHTSELQSRGHLVCR